MILTLELYIQLGYYLKNGDWIGHVKEITLYKTTLRTRDNPLVSMPNDVLMNETMVNYNFPESLTGREVTIGVLDESDPKVVTNLLLEIVRNLDVVAAEKCPEVNVLILQRSAVGLKFLIR